MRINTKEMCLNDTLFEMTGHLEKQTQKKREVILSSFFFSFSSSSLLWPSDRFDSFPIDSHRFPVAFPIGISLFFFLFSHWISFLVLENNFVFSKTCQSTVVLRLFPPYLKTLFPVFYFSLFGSVFLCSV